MTAAWQGWAGRTNGAPLNAAGSPGFDVIITADQGLVWIDLTPAA